MDGKTYNNSCLMKCKSVSLNHNGQCKKKCNCYLDFKWQVCGQDGKTYRNSCRMNCAGVKLKYSGKCKPDCICTNIY